MSSPLQVVVSLVKVFLLDLNLRYLIQSTALQELVLTLPDDLLEVKDGIIPIIQLLQCLSFVKVGFRH